mmetsp:Transcript_19623/g.34724  ORF Transcript_19623/g.34724 Transcript_19623/m.34724 type:complete len:321 (+) Transcript_19623:479-1441(+)
MNLLLEELRMAPPLVGLCCIAIVSQGILHEQRFFDRLLRSLLLLGHCNQVLLRLLYLLLQRFPNVVIRKPPGHVIFCFYQEDRMPGHVPCVLVDEFHLRLVRHLRDHRRSRRRHPNLWLYGIQKDVVHLCLLDDSVAGWSLLALLLQEALHLLSHPTFLHCSPLGNFLALHKGVPVVLLGVTTCGLFDCCFRFLVLSNLCLVVLRQFFERRLLTLFMGLEAFDLHPIFLEQSLHELPGILPRESLGFLFLLDQRHVLCQQFPSRHWLPSFLFRHHPLGELLLEHFLHLLDCHVLKLRLARAMRATRPLRGRATTWSHSPR